MNSLIALGVVLLVLKLVTDGTKRGGFLSNPETKKIAVLVGGLLSWRLVWHIGSFAWGFTSTVIRLFSPHSLGGAAALGKELIGLIINVLLIGLVYQAVGTITEVGSFRGVLYSFGQLLLFRLEVPRSEDIFEKKEEMDAEIKAVSEQQSQAEDPERKVLDGRIKKHFG